MRMRGKNRAFCATKDNSAIPTETRYKARKSSGADILCPCTCDKKNCGDCGRAHEHVADDLKGGRKIRISAGDGRSHSVDGGADLDAVAGQW